MHFVEDLRQWSHSPLGLPDQTHLSLNLKPVSQARRFTKGGFVMHGAVIFGLEVILDHETAEA